MPTYEELGYGRGAYAQTDSRAVFGQVMGLVAATVAFAALGAYIMRNSAGGTGIASFVGAIGCMIGLNFAVARGREQLAIGLLFGLGLLLGMGAGPVINYYAHAQPGVVWQAAVTTAGGVAALGAYGYSTSRDLSSWAKPLLWALVGLILFGIVAMLIAIPHANIIYAVAGLGIFSALTILDFWRLRQSPIQAAPLIAASIFLDVWNIFLLLLQLFGGTSRD